MYFVLLTMMFRLPNVLTVVVMKCSSKSESVTLLMYGIAWPLIVLMVVTVFLAGLVFRLLTTTCVPSDVSFRVIFWLMLRPRVGDDRRLVCKCFYSFFLGVLG